MAPPYTVDPKPPERKLTANQIAYEAIQAGFSGGDVVTAVAIALAESGGNANAFNDNPITRDLSYGLWQINMYGDLGPARRKQFGIDSNEKLFGTAINAKAAKIIKDGQGWTAWSVYKSGKYRAFIMVADMGAKNPEATNVVEGQTNTVVDLTKPFKDLFAWILKELGPSFVRLAGFVGGGVLIILAIVLYAKQSGMLKALPVGRLAGVAGKVGKAAA